MKILLEKGDSEEIVRMAEALLANGLVSAIERVSYQCVKVQKSDDEVAKAVIDVVGSFGVCTQWTAVYRVLVDFCGWDVDVAKFTKRMNNLLKGVRLSRKCTYQSIQKPLAQNRGSRISKTDVYSRKTAEITFYLRLNIRLNDETYYLKVIKYSTMTLCLLLQRQTKIVAK